jgi:hypothetical protein
MKNIINILDFTFPSFPYMPLKYFKPTKHCSVRGTSREANSKIGEANPQIGEADLPSIAVTFQKWTKFSLYLKPILQDSS